MKASWEGLRACQANGPSPDGYPADLDELGATPGQIVLSWLLARSQPPIIPIPGASTVGQLGEILAATELTLDAETISRLGLAGRNHAWLKQRTAAAKPR